MEYLNTEKKYDVFISYSHKDKSSVSVIEKSLESLGRPFYRRYKPDIRIFRDERKIPLNNGLNSSLIQGLKLSKHLIVIASKNAAKSSWVKHEIRKWYELNHDENGNITNVNIILLSDHIEWDQNLSNFDFTKTTALPHFEEKLFEDLPLWANLSTFVKSDRIDTLNISYQWEIAKIKGWLLTKSPDEIIDEEARQKRNQFTFIGLILILLLSLTYFTLFLKQKAEFEAQTNALLLNSKKYLKDYITEFHEFKEDESILVDQIQLTDTVYFDFDKVTIKPETQHILDPIIEFTKENPKSIVFIKSTQAENESLVGERFEFDTESILDYGLKVSKIRSKNLENYFIDKGINSNRIKSFGLAIFTPDSIYQNLNETQLAKMRKGVITVYDR